MLTDDEIVEARRLWKEGFDTHEIAQSLGVEEHTIYNSRRYIDKPYLALPGVVMRRREQIRIIP